MGIQRNVLLVSIATLSVMALYIKSIARAEIDGGLAHVTHLNIMVTYTLAAFAYIAIFDVVIGLREIIGHKLLGIPFVLPLLIFINEIRRNRDPVEESVKKDKYGVFRVNILVSIALILAGLMSNKSKLQITSVSLAMALVLVPVSSSLPGSSEGIVLDAIQRVAIICSTWLTAAIVLKELSSEKATLKILNTFKK